MDNIDQMLIDKAVCHPNMAEIRVYKLGAQP